MSNHKFAFIASLYEEREHYNLLLKGTDLVLYKGTPNCLKQMLQEVALVILPGGADISPEYYNTKAHVYTNSNPQSDKNEYEIIQMAVEAGIPIFGICKGFQWLHVLTKGQLVQHIEKPHKAYHTVEDKDQNEFLVNSLHHQSVGRELLEGGQIRATAPDGLIEAAIWPKRYAGVQWHPEYGNCPVHAIRFANQLLKELMESCK